MALASPKADKKAGKSPKEEILLNLGRLCEGVALYWFHVTARALDEAGKRYAKKEWGCSDWVRKACSNSDMSNNRKKKIFPDGECHEPKSHAVDECWDTYDLLVMLMAAVFQVLREQPKDFSSIEPACRNLDLYYKLRKAFELRMLISHTESPPLGNIASSLEAYRESLQRIGVSEPQELTYGIPDSIPITNLADLQKLTDHIRDLIQITNQAGHTKPEEKCNFPLEAVRGGVVLTALYHVEDALTQHCESGPLAKLFAAEKLTHDPENTERPMELRELLYFLEEHQPREDFALKYRKPLCEFRNNLFHRPDHLLPPAEVFGTNAFWDKYKKLLGPDGILSPNPNPSIKEAREHIEMLKNATEKLWKDRHNHKEVPVRVSLPNNPSTPWICRPWLGVVFVGREGEINQVAQRIADKAGAKVLLYGQPGIGKSSLAIECAHRLRSTSRLRRQHLFHCTTVETFLSSLWQFNASFGIHQPSQGLNEKTKKEDLCQSALDFLETADRMLLVFDDVQCSEAEEFLKNKNLKEHPVISTRRTPLTSLQVDFDLKLELQEMDTADSLKILARIVDGGRKSVHDTQHWPDIDNTEEWLKRLQPKGDTKKPSPDWFVRLKEALKKRLCNVPLYVEITGHHLSKRSFESIEGLIDKLMHHCPMQEFQGKVSSSNYPLAISGVVNMAMATVMKNSVAVKKLAVMVSVTANPLVPVQVLEAAIVDVGVTTTMVDELKSLQAAGLLQLRDNGKNVFMHPLIQHCLVETLKERLSDINYEELAKDLSLSVIKHIQEPHSRLSDSLDDKQFRLSVASCASRLVCSFLFPPVDDILPSSDKHKLILLNGLFYQLGAYHIEDSHYNVGASAKAAVDYLSSCNKIVKCLAPDDREEQGNIANHLGLAYIWCGEYDKAEEVLKLPMEEFDEHHPMRYRTNYVTCFLLTKQRKFSAAKDMALRVLDSLSQHSPATQRDLFKKATWLCNVGNILMHGREFDKAEKSLEESWSILTNILPEDDISCAPVLSNFGDLSGRREQWLKAKSYYEQCLVIKKKCYGDNHVKLATTLTGFSFVLLKLNELPRASEMAEKALEIKKKRYGNGHQELASTLTNLGCIRHKQGLLCEAQRLLEEALEIKRRCYGPDEMERDTTSEVLEDVNQAIESIAAFWLCCPQAKKRT